MVMPTEKQIVKYLTELAEGYQRNDEMFEAKLVTEPLSSTRWANGMAAARGALLALEQALDYIKDGKVIAPPPEVKSE